MAQGGFGGGQVAGDDGALCAIGARRVGNAAVNVSWTWGRCPVLSRVLPTACADYNQCTVNHTEERTGKSGQMARILVVDDEPDQRFLTRRIFTRAGYEVAEAEDGSVALAAMRESPPDLLVTDMTMPVMNGAELIRRVHGEPAMAHIPIVAVSGDPHLAGAADAILTKPFDWQELVATVDRLLKEGRGPR